TDDPAYINRVPGEPEAQLKTLLAEEPNIARILANAEHDTPTRKLTASLAGLKTLHGQDFVLLGNAGEFLDPIFSSGVTVAFQSAELATPLIDRHLNGKTVDWNADFETPLRD